MKPVVEELSQPLHGSLFALEVLSLSMLLLVLLQWRKRAATGFKFGDGIRRNDWELPDLFRLCAILILIYSAMLILQYTFSARQILATNDGKALFFVIFQNAFYGFFFFLTGFHLHRIGVSWSSTFGLKNMSFSKTLLVACVTLMAVLIPIDLVEIATYKIFDLLKWPVYRQPILDFLFELKNPWLKAGMIVIATIGAPLFEETLFRGILYPSLKKNAGFFHALWITSLAFAVIHFHLPSTPALFCLAVVFTLVYEWTGSILSCILVHTGFNTLSLTFAYFRETSF